MPARAGEAVGVRPAIRTVASTGVRANGFSSATRRSSAFGRTTSLGAISTPSVSGVKSDSARPPHRAAARVHGGVDGGLPVEEEELRGRDLHRAPRDLQRHGLGELARDERADRRSELGLRRAGDVGSEHVDAGHRLARVQRGAAHEHERGEAEQQDEHRGSTERAAQTARRAQGARLENGHGR